MSGARRQAPGVFLCVFLFFFFSPVRWSKLAFLLCPHVTWLFSIHVRICTRQSYHTLKEAYLAFTKQHVTGVDGDVLAKKHGRHGMAGMAAAETRGAAAGTEKTEETGVTVIVIVAGTGEGTACTTAAWGRTTGPSPTKRPSPPAALVLVLVLLPPQVLALTLT